MLKLPAVLLKLAGEMGRPGYNIYREKFVQLLDLNLPVGCIANYWAFQEVQPIDG